MKEITKEFLIRLAKAHIAGVALASKCGVKAGLMAFEKSFSKKPQNGVRSSITQDEIKQCVIQASLDSSQPDAQASVSNKKQYQHASGSQKEDWSRREQEDYDAISPYPGKDGTPEQYRQNTEDYWAWRQKYTY